MYIQEKRREIFLWKYRTVKKGSSSSYLTSFCGMKNDDHDVPNQLSYFMMAARSHALLTLVGKNIISWLHIELRPKCWLHTIWISSWKYQATSYFVSSHFLQHVHYWTFWQGFTSKGVVKSMQKHGKLLAIWCSSSSSIIIEFRI